MAESFKLPAASLDELIKIIQAYANEKEGVVLSLDDISQSNVAIIKINSAIYSHDDSDYKKLGLSKIQLDTLTNQYKAIKEKNNIGLSIALIKCMCKNYNKYIHIKLSTYTSRLSNKFEK